MTEENTSNFVTKTSLRKMRVKWPKEEEELGSGLEVKIKIYSSAKQLEKPREKEKPTPWPICCKCHGATHQSNPEHFPQYTPEGIYCWKCFWEDYLERA